MGATRDQKTEFVPVRRDATPQEEVDDLESLLDSIPEIEGEKQASPFAPFQRAALTAGVDEVAVVEAPPMAGGDVTKQVEDLSLAFSLMRRELESAFTRELERVEGSFNVLLSNMESRLKQSESELITALEENQRVKAEHERKAETLRELKRALEKLE